MTKHHNRQFATTFQDLVTKVKSLVALAPVLGAISRPDWLMLQEYFEELMSSVEK